MNLVTTPFFSILLNDSPKKLFHPCCVMRKGDPLSPFLFILMEKVLSKLIHSQKVGGEVCGLTLHEQMDKQIHRKFVDDTMLMGHPLVQAEQDFKKSLNLFEKYSGLVINANKSQVLFLNIAPIV